MCRERDQARQETFAKLLLAVPLRCLVSADETHEDSGGVRRRRGQWLRGVRYECQLRDRRAMLRTSTMMAVSYTNGALHSLTTPSPQSQNADGWILFLNGLLATMNRFLHGLPWVLQPNRCGLLYDNAPIHSAEADAFIGHNEVSPLRLPPYSPEFQPTEEMFSEYSHQLKSAHVSYPGSPEAPTTPLALAIRARI